MYRVSHPTIVEPELIGSEFERESEIPSGPDIWRCDRDGWPWSWCTTCVHDGGSNPEDPQ